MEKNELIGLKKRAVDLAAQCWQDSTTEHLTMEPPLAIVFAKELDRWMKPNLGLATTKELFDELTARAETTQGFMEYTTVKPLEIQL